MGVKVDMFVGLKNQGISTSMFGNRGAGGVSLSNRAWFRMSMMVWGPMMHNSGRYQLNGRC